ncbi:hypothetical protein GCM10022247_08280 [Allokutzneria multivorans]|uniref:Uncharacterized protein n=1 Tax=Allokutzneria multivorans TaxID=1142134 RepID=A0ABP7R2N9_9PSEU
MKIAHGVTAALVATSLVVAGGTAHAARYVPAECSAAQFTGKLEGYENNGYTVFSYSIEKSSVGKRNKANVTVWHGKHKVSTAKGFQDGAWRSLGDIKRPPGGAAIEYRFSFVFDDWGSDPRCSGTIDV